MIRRTYLSVVVVDQAEHICFHLCTVQELDRHIIKKKIVVCIVSVVEYDQYDMLWTNKIMAKAKNLRRYVQYISVSHGLSINLFGLTLEFVTVVVLTELVHWAVYNCRCNCTFNAEFWQKYVFFFIIILDNGRWVAQILLFHYKCYNVCLVYKIKCWL